MGDIACAIEIVFAVTASAANIKQAGNAAQALCAPCFRTGSQSITYTISAPAGTPLETLCRANSNPDQGTWACAATMKNNDVYAVVFFNETSLVLKNYPSPGSANSSPPPPIVVSAQASYIN